MSSPTSRLLQPALLAALMVCLVLAGGGGPAAAGRRDGQRGTVQGPAGAALDAYLRRLEVFGFSGSVLAARRGQVLLDKGYGFADEATGEPYTAATVFDIASVSKQFTAAAILALEMEGKLRVVDTLARFFPGAPADKAGITLHQLLTHTSGMPDVLGAEYDPISRDEMLHRAFAAPLALPPGKRFRYSNAGYSVLAAVVEIAAGRPFGDFLRERLFLPAGMHHTGYRLSAEDRRRLAHGYGLDGPWGTPLERPWAVDGPWWNLRGNGGVLSTTGDLYRWHLALGGDRVLSRPEREKLVTPYVREGHATPSRYAYGWSIAPGPTGGRVASHTGGNGIFDTDVRRYLDDAAVLVASSNRTDFSAVTVGPHLENRLFGLPDPEPPATASLDSARLRRCAGIYVLAGGERLRAAVARGGLRISAEGPAGLALLLAAQDDEERQRMRDRGEKVDAALAGARRGEFAPLADLFGLEVGQVEPPFQQAMRRFERELGAWTGHTVLGSASVEGYPFTYARLTFERGTRLAQYRWEGPTVEVARYPAEPAAQLYLPELRAAGSQESGVAHFASYDLRTGAVQRLRVTLPGRGPALALVVETPAGDAAALRSGG